MSSDWLDDDIDDATYAQQMQAREERRIARDLGVHATQEGIEQGIEQSLQGGFNRGFEDGVALGRAWGRVQGAVGMMEQLIQRGGVERSDEEHDELLARIRALTADIQRATDRLATRSTATSEAATLSLEEASQRARALLAETRVEGAAALLP